jgi:hypothetical protein
MQRLIYALALFCWSCFGLFQLVSAYSLSQNTIESAETSQLFHQPNQSFGWIGADANMFLFASFAACPPKMLAPVDLPT